MPSLLLIITLLFGERNTWSNIKSLKILWPCLQLLYVTFHKSLLVGCTSKWGPTQSVSLILAEWTLIKKLCEPVPCLYVVTGSHFTCSFYGLDNTKRLFLLERNVLFTNAFTLIALEENVTWKRAELKWLRDSFVNRMETKICDAIWRVFGNRPLCIILRNLIQLTMTDTRNLNLLDNFGNNFLWLQSWILQNNQISVSELPFKT